MSDETVWNDLSDLRWAIERLVDAIEALHNKDASCCVGLGRACKVMEEIKSARKHVE